VVVVDASALCAIAFDDEMAGEVVARLKGEALHAPSLLQLEMTNATLSRCRSTPALAERFVAGLTRVLDLPMTIHKDTRVSVPLVERYNLALEDEA
jgi:predicted nucleic acid-binding protein